MYGTSYIIKKSRWTLVKNEAGWRWNVHFLATIQFGWRGHILSHTKKNWNPEISSDIADLCPIYSCVFHMCFTCVSHVFHMCFTCVSHVFHMCCPIDTNVCTRGYPRGFNIPLCLQDFGKSRVHFCAGAQTFSAFWWWLSTPGHRLELFFSRECTYRN